MKLLLKQYGVINLSDIKRVSLYLNIKNPVEKEIWEFLQSYGKKNECIRNALYQYIHQSNIVYAKPIVENKPEDKNDLSKEEVDYLNNIIIG